MMTTQTSAPAAARAHTEAFGPAVLAILLGTFLVFGVGFAHPQAIHDAAHDARHAFAFPCH
ncbi:MAG TPA: CbtB-domain containing protein [Arenibaculum sp.]|nr:CbtB-domain containing protein [Arenibaculum sp.]